uniref:histidine kinase n=1 Tax=Aplanochytrium stocchinoi TaxID=215587 RepID=A0A7S3LPP0_9STRA|mmetsp:Transcript_1463/g.2244  ORF Transcript_1463/g.2244 Transcript_1463/m.2244 type:complete len:853 (-) Transcript_1463:1401-3959(-)
MLRSSLKMIQSNGNSLHNDSKIMVDEPAPNNHNGDQAKAVGISSESLENDSGSSGTSSSDGVKRSFFCWRWRSVEYSVFGLEICFAGLIIFVGIGLALGFLLVGINNERERTVLSVDNVVTSKASELQTAFSDYVVATAWIHQFATSGLLTRESFRELYLSVLATGLDFQAAEFIPNVTHADRAASEAEAEAYYAANYPQVNYQGFTGFEGGNCVPQQRSNQSFYFPVHYVEPVLDNAAAIDFDLYSSDSRRMTIDLVLQTWEPAVTARLRLVQEKEGSSAYSVLLLYPGAKNVTALEPRDLAILVIRIPALLERVFSKQDSKSLQNLKGTKIYLFDTTHNDRFPQFLGGVAPADDGSLRLLPETELQELKEQSSVTGDDELIFTMKELKFASSRWVMVFLVEKELELTTVIAGTFLIAFCSLLIGSWFACTVSRAHYITRLKADARREKTRNQIQNAQESARAERELNDFIAHEVRNPLSAALSALTFVDSAVSGLDKGDEQKATLLEDTRVIEVSLKYINDLLRNTLDLHCSQSGQMKLKTSQTDIRRDILEPVKSMLSRRHNEFEIVIDCPADLVAIVDRLRLEQVVMNLAGNAAKFVTVGYIHLRAAVSVDNKVEISIEDSGPGIPKEKRTTLFLKYQESLDTLNQGTGIGLCLCQNLVALMDGDLWLDESYDCGIPGFTGTRMVVKLNVSPIPPSEVVQSLKKMSKHESNDNVTSLLEPSKNLKILFVEDEMILRKLFARVVKRVYPEVEIEEAACGEAALEMAKNDQFDVIFVDQYMASANKTLLGTETVHAMRSAGVNSVIVGCSANDVRDTFMDAGADFFVFKPFPQTKSQVRKLFDRCAQLLR